MKTQLNYRLYFFLCRNLSDTSKGIQAGHAALEYANIYGNDPEYKQFISNNKTWILLNGGISNDDVVYDDSLQGIEDILKNNNIKYSKFIEPDLNNCLTAICVLIDERVYDFKNYPNFIEYNFNNSIDIKEDESEIIKEYEMDFLSYKEHIGGEANYILKKLIYKRKLT
jgi:hypothetical protein